MEVKRKVIMVDMDGTLTDPFWRDKWSPKNGGTWKLFHEKCGADFPIERIVCLIKELSNSYDLVISTARPEYTRSATIDWLKKHDLEYTAVFMRDEGQRKMKSPELKLFHKEIIEEWGVEIAFIIDDRKDVCDVFAKVGIQSILVNENNQPTIEVAGQKIKPMPHSLNIEDATDFSIDLSINIEYTPDEILKESGEFFKKRNEEYGDAWKRHGAIMKANFPDGVTLKTEKDFFMYHCLVMDVVKTTRICNAMSDGKDHKDSWTDKIVYSAMAKSQIKE